MKVGVGKVLKTDKGDAYLLWKVYELSLFKKKTHRCFKELTLVDVELRPLFVRENMLCKNLERM